MRDSPHLLNRLTQVRSDYAPLIEGGRHIQDSSRDGLSHELIRMAQSPHLQQEMRVTPVD